MVHRDLTPNEIEKKKKEIFVEEGEDCIDKMLNHVNKKWKGDPKIVRNGVIARYDNKLIAQNAVRFDNWVVLQKLNPSSNVKADGSIDPFGEKRIVKNSRGILSIKVFNGYVGKFHQYVTFK